MFSLGMTADAAAAHRQHDSRLPSERQGSLVRQAVLASSLPPLKIALDVLEGSSHKRRSLPTMVKEQSTYGSSDEDYSRSNSLQSQTTSQNGSTSKRRSNRPKTSFQLAHPPPVIKHKKRLRIRPRLLLQLQQLSEAARPTPALDVLPSTIFAPSLASKFPRAFKGKASLGTNDLIIVSSESYESSRVVPDDDKSDTSEEELWDHREVIGTICQLPKWDGGTRGKVEIAFNQGSTWEGMPLTNGSYEFVSTDTHGLQTIARWVPRSKARRRTSTLLPSHGTLGDDDKKFTFSLVNPNTRRHPVIAAMNRICIDVSDQYPPSATTSPKTPTSPTLSPSSINTRDTSYFEALDLPEQAMVQTDDHLRTLIVVTGVWVAFRENWSKNFNYNDAMAAPLGSVTNAQSQHRRNTSNGQAKIKREQSMDAFDPSPRGGLHHMSDNIRRTSTSLLRRSSPAPSPNQFRGGTSPVPPPRRSFSTGAAFIEKANRRSLSMARKSRPAASSEESDDEHNGNLSGISTPTKAVLRTPSSARRSMSMPLEVDLAARIEKRRVQIEEPKCEDASDEAILVENAASTVGTAEIKASLSGVSDIGKDVGKHVQAPRRRWRRIFSFLNRSNRGVH